MKPNEQILRKWEKDPLRYKDEIKALDRQLTDEHRRRMESPTCYYRAYQAFTPEWIAGAKADIQLLNLMTRVTNMCIAVNSLESKARDEQHLREMEEYERKAKQTLQHDRQLAQQIVQRSAPRRRRVVISNDVATLCAAADQYQWEQWMKRHPVVGMA